MSAAPVSHWPPKSRPRGLLAAFSTFSVENRNPRPWWNPAIARMTAMPRVPRTSTYTPNSATRPMTLAPVMLSVVWMSRRTIVVIRMVVWLVASRPQSNQLFIRAVV